MKVTQEQVSGVFLKQNCQLVKRDGYKEFE